VVLGLYKGGISYVDAAKQIGANALNVRPQFVANLFLRTGNWWALNQAFVRASVARGQQVYLSTAPNAARIGSFFAQELQYLQNLGVGPDQWLMVSPYLYYTGTTPVP
jgi:hypothetical protein